jgi:hypothetical protein
LFVLDGAELQISMFLEHIWQELEASGLGRKKKKETIREAPHPPPRPWSQGPILARQQLTLTLPLRPASSCFFFDLLAHGVVALIRRESWKTHLNEEEDLMMSSQTGAATTRPVGGGMWTWAVALFSPQCRKR